MAEKENEPQSYGSQSEWVRGDVGQEVNRQKGNPNSQHSDFYESRHTEEEQPSTVSPQQIDDNREASGQALEEGEPIQKVSDEPGGARRDSYFKRRDYK